MYVKINIYQSNYGCSPLILYTVEIYKALKEVHTNYNYGSTLADRLQASYTCISLCTLSMQLNIVG